MMLPGFELQVWKWERKLLIEKDEEFNPVMKDGKPVIYDSWIILTVVVGGSKFNVDVDTVHFDKNILPTILDPLIRFWRSISVGHSLFPERENMLAFFLEEKAQNPALCEP